MSKTKVNELAPFSSPGIGIGAPTVSPAVLLNIQSTTQGIAIPRMTTAQRNAIASPFNGLFVYNTDTNALEHYNGSSWESDTGIQSINGQSAKNQILTTGTSGTAPNWTQSGSDTNSFNIPLAHTPTVTAGLVSNTEWESFNDRLYPAQNVRYVVKNPTLGPQDFNSIEDAVDSIIDATSTNPYVVIVAPGVYVEDTIMMKPFVWVVGSGQYQTVIQVNATNKHVIVGADNSGISKCLLTGATASGFAAIYYQSLTGTTNTAFFAEDVRFGTNDTLAISDGTNSATAIFIENAKFGSIYPFNHGFLSRNSGRIAIRNSTTTGLSAPFPDFVFKATGAGSQMVLNGIQCRAGSVTSGACIHLADGALLRALSVNMRMFGKALWIENVGDPSIVDAVGILMEANTMDLQVDHPGADGTINGSMDHTKIFVNPSSTFSPVFSCNHLPSDSTGFVTVGTILQGDRFDRMANLSLLARKATTLGVIEDEETSFVDAVSGLEIKVNAGRGFVNDPTDIYLKEVTWPDTNLILDPDSINYITVDSNGLVAALPALPSLETFIMLGRVVTRTSSIIFIENSDLPMNHYGNKMEVLLRTGLGPVFHDGVIVTEDATPLKLDSTAGQYFYGIDVLSVGGGTEISWNSYYRDGSSGWTESIGDDTVSNSLYDDGSGTLANIPSGKYAKHTLYVVGDSGDEQWFLIYGQAVYDTLAEAQDSPLPIVPPFIADAVVRVAGVIVQEGQPNIQFILDYRPRFGFAAPSGTAVTNHGDLTGLLDDDHPQYLLVDGSRPMSGPLNMGGQAITNVGNVDGVDVSSHASRHLPNGADPLTTAAPLSNLNATSTNATGTANSMARSDHSHAIDTGTASSQIPDQANATGTSANIARADHVHNIPTAAPSGTIGANSVNGQGINASFARSDHQHQLAIGTPVTITPDQANSAGTSNNIARADHIHAIVTATPVSVGTANAQGAASSFSRSDHVHNHGAQTDPTQHAVATTGANGFMSSTDKTKLDGLPASAVPTSRTLTAGAGLTGGGDLSADRTFNVGANADGSIQVNADDIQVGVLATDAQHGARGGGTQHAAATTSVNGFMSAADKTKLDGISGTRIFKSGIVAGASFAGNPKTFAVVFGTAFPNTNYTINITGANNRTWSYQAKATTGFTINANANAALTGEVSWSAVSTGETVE